jgi:hypothetical protein
MRCVAHSPAQDLWRAASENASAYFIIAPKYPEDATLADRYLSMCVLSLGQYLQEVHAMLQTRLQSLPERITHWFQHGTVRFGSIADDLGPDQEVLPCFYHASTRAQHWHGRNPALINSDACIHMLLHLQIMLFLAFWVTLQGPGRQTHRLFQHTVDCSALQVVPPGRLPSVYLQVCLPEGRLRLFQVLQSLQDSRLPLRAAVLGATCAAGLHMGANSTEDAAPGAAKDAAAVEEAEEAAAGEFDTLGASKTSRWAPESADEGPNSTAATAAAAAATGRARASRAAAQRVPAAVAARSDMGTNGDARVDLSSYQNLSPSPRSMSKTSAQGHPQQQQQQSKGLWGRWLAALTACFGSCTAGPASNHKPLPMGTEFWEEFSGSIHLLCLAEIKYAMMAQSVVGVPGVMTLLCNLSTTVDFGLEMMQETSYLPSWMRDYMVGASQELYKLRRFPTTLVGRSVKEAAGFIFDSYHAVLLAVEPTTGLQRHRMIVGDLQQVCMNTIKVYWQPQCWRLVQKQCRRVASPTGQHAWLEVPGQHTLSCSL